MLVFEELKAKAEFEVYRARIPGGWLVAMKYYHTEHDTEMKIYNDSGAGWGWGAGYGYGGMTFVPDPLHQWDGSSLEYQKPSQQQTQTQSRDKEPRW